MEAIINERPITYVSSDLSYPMPLAPSQLICGHRIITMPDTVSLDEISDPSVEMQSLLLEDLRD